MTTILNTALFAVILALTIVLTVLLFAGIKAAGVLCGVWVVWTANAVLLAIAAIVFTRSV